MHVRKLRRVGPERVLGVPGEFLEKMNAEFMTVSMEDGRLVYTPVREV